MNLVNIKNHSMLFVQFVQILSKHRNLNEEQKSCVEFMTQLIQVFTNVFQKRRKRKSMKFLKSLNNCINQGSINFFGKGPVNE